MFVPFFTDQNRRSKWFCMSLIGSFSQPHRTATINKNVCFLVSSILRGSVSFTANGAYENSDECQISMLTISNGFSNIWDFIHLQLHHFWRRCNFHSHWKEPLGVDNINRFLERKYMFHEVIACCVSNLEENEKYGDCMCAKGLNSRTKTGKNQWRSRTMCDI